MAQSDGSIIIDTLIDDVGFQKGLSAMKNAAVTGMAAITAAIGAASIAVITLGSDFEQANAKASTLFGDAQVDMSAYQGKMLDLSNKTGLAASELGNTMYDALSAGIPASDDMAESIAFLEKNSKLAKAGFTDVNTATTATAKVLNAYKMDVSETDRVHKILMQTQNKGITTVNELGSVLSQVTPTASAMNVSFEQVGAALANMTAQGTPTAQATTQLNGLIAELGKNGTIGAKSFEEAAKGTEYAGKSFSKLMKDGVPLNKVLDVMSDYAEENNLSMIDMFSSIEAGKAALSISGQNSEQFTSNLEAMSTQCDVVGDAYEKVTDTFQAKSEKVVNSFKNVGIAAYEKFQEPLKGAMDSAQISVDTLASEMGSGKLGESVDKIAEGFGDLISKTAELASDVIPLVINGFAFLVDNGEAVTVAMAGLSAAVIYYKNQTLISNTIEAVSASLKTVSAAASLAYDIIQKTLAKDLTVTAAAHELLNISMKSNPVGMVTVAIGALVAGITALCFAMNDTDEETKELWDSLNQTNEKWKELKETQEKQLSTDLTQIESTKRLRDELSFLVDENGKVQEGYEARAKFIIGELNSALGTEYSLTDMMIDNYDELSSSVDNLIQKKRAKAILDAQEPLYQEAINKQMQEANEIGKLNAEIQSKVNEQQSLENELIAQYGENYLDGAMDAKDARLQEYGNLSADIVEKNNLLKGFEESYDQHTNEIINYENNMMLASSENAEDWGKLQTDIQAGAATTYTEKKKYLEEELGGLQYHYEYMLKRQKEGDTKITDAEIERAKQSIENKTEELKGLQTTTASFIPALSEEHKKMAIENLKSLKSQSEKYFGVSEEEIDNLIAGLESKDKDAQIKAEEIAQNIYNNLSSKNGEYSKSGAFIMDGIMNGMQSKLTPLLTNTKSIGELMVREYKKAIEVKSPSRAFARVSKYIPEGIAKGINDNTGVVDKSITNLSDDMINAFDSQFSTAEIDNLLRPLEEAVFAEQMRMSASVSGTVQHELLTKTNPIVVENSGDPINYKKLGRYVAEAITQAGITVKYDNRSFGRIIKEVIK